MTRIAWILCSIILLGMTLVGSDGHAQGLFLGKGQSGTYYSGGWYAAEDISGFGLGIGGTYRGLVDLGFATTKTTTEYCWGPYGGSSDLWTTGIH